MEKVSFETSQNVMIDYPLASLGERILAFLLDFVIFIAYYLLMFLILTSIKIDLEFTNIVFIIAGLPIVFYHLICEAFFEGQSIGKKQMNIKVVKVDGQQPSLGAYIIRWIMRLVDIVIFFGGLAMLFIIVTAKGQRLGDLLAGTTVVKIDRIKDISLHRKIDDVEDGYLVTFNQAIDLTDNDIEIIKQALRTYKNSGVREPVLAAEAKVKELLDVQSDLPPIKFLHTVIKDHNYLAYQQWQAEQ
ncbi:MAG: RDD family protein [Cyclobacteriaceae bacterium]